MTAHDVALYFLAHPKRESDLSNLKLQKLIYYAQAVHLIAYGRPLFDDPIEAWEFGPVVKSVYDEYKTHGKDPIPPVHQLDLTRYNEPTRRVLDGVSAWYGQFAAWKLSDMAHSDLPWLEASATAGVINLQSMKAYFESKFGGFMMSGQPIELTGNAAERFLAIQNGSVPPIPAVKVATSEVVIL